VVHLSRREGLPRALSQALAASRPIVAYDCDGAREVCLQDQTGHLLPVGDINGVVRALCQLHHNPERRREMGDFGRSFVRKEFSESHMVARIHELYRSLLDRYRADNQK
ncbi:MAG: glycosyltransferase, partial [Verrucomicrobia bacterium]|nr:glycosyltransferase [Verrucomicrobiota bacterium]